MSGRRRNFSIEEKLQILKRHLVGKENVSDICEDINIHVNQFYNWQGDLFNHGPSFFKQDSGLRKEAREVRNLKKDVQKLKAKIEKKDNVIAEITEEYVSLKKNDSAY